MNVLEVVLPVVQRGIEWKRLALFSRHLFPDGHEVARIEDAVDLGVDAVELNQVDTTVETLALCVQVVGQAGNTCSERQPLDQPLSGLDESQRGLGPRRQLLASGKRPVRCADRLALAVAQRKLAEVTASRTCCAPDTRRVADPRRRL